MKNRILLTESTKYELIRIIRNKTGANKEIPRSIRNDRAGGYCFFSFFFFLFIFPAFAQEKSFVFGKIIDENKQPIPVVNIAALGFAGGTSSDENGKFELSVPSGQEISVVFSHLSFESFHQKIKLSPGEKFEINPSLKKTTREITEFEVEGEKELPSAMKRIDPKLVKFIPSASGSFEAILFSQPGVSSNNELSSQYSVRGGNFDENLVYVNDIEIYRPFLIRAGQQEGLSFINSELTESVLFSSGGFEAKYGDKMASVLDIKYKEPTPEIIKTDTGTIYERGSGSAEISMLGAGLHVEDASKDYRFTQIHGLRYKTNQYLLGALDTKGAYKPAYVDYQSYFTFDITDKLELGLLTNVSGNKYRFEPETRQSDFGTINQALRLTVYFEGQEIDRFTTYFGAFNAIYKPQKNTELKFISSVFKTQEEETFDILGQYWLDELERDLSKENFGDIAFNRGIGSYLHHARNYLDALVFNIDHKGQKIFERHSLLWGAKYQHESILDELHEWKMLDSADYSLPHPSDNLYLAGDPNPWQRPEQFIQLNEVFITNNHLETNRVIGYLQENFTLKTKDTSEYIFTLGVRGNYWDLNKQFLASPRATLSFKPNRNKNLIIRASSGYYQQLPFYREMRNLYGKINYDIKAQTSIHYVLGADYNFFAWKRPFKLLSEMYYKQFYNLIPYEIDNVRIRYYATNNSRGYAMGIDTKVNGEFVRGAESWVSLSVMQVKEDIIDDYYYEYLNSKGEKIIFGYSEDDIAVDSIRYEPGYIPRPTDQRVNFGLFFQDYIPKHPQFKMHLNLLYGSGLPFGPPSYEKYKDTLRISAYRRVDIGFSAQLKGEEKKSGERNPFRKFKSIWMSMEVFNLLQINNTISYIWIKDVTNRQYAVPNYLTARRLNLKFVFRF